MSERLEGIAHEYGPALQAYLKRCDELTLSHAYQLGRRALGDGLGVMDMVSLHRSAVESIVAEAPVEQRSGLAASALDFLRELLSAFETTFRGHHEANERLASAHERHIKRLHILHEIEHAVVANKSPGDIAAAVIKPLRDLLQVPRAIVNAFDLAAGEVEWIAAAGRRRVHVGPGVRYSIKMMGSLEALMRNEPQIVNTHSLPPGPEVDALLASGVHQYMVMPMIAGGVLIGALSFGGEPGTYSAEQVEVAQEVAMQLAIAVMQARLYATVKRHTEELELRVRDRTRELQNANKSLEAFSYSVAHDLRAPLRSIDGFSKLILEDYQAKLDDRGKKYLDHVRTSAQHMGLLIDALLSLARVTRANMQRTEVDLSAIASRIADRLQGTSPNRRAEILVEQSMQAECDSKLLTVVLENLLGNAWKFTSGRELARIAFGRQEDERGTVYFVRDNGAGFDMRYVDKLFGAFQRLHSVTEFEGTGVGLATVQRIIHRHGGEVWAEAKVNEGATISFTLRDRSTAV